MIGDRVGKYFSNLDKDLQALCPSLQAYEYHNEYYTTIMSLHHTGKVLRQKRSTRSITPPPAQTDLGGRVAELYLSGEKFSRWRKGMPGVCGEAEWKVAHSLTDEQIYDSKLPSPIILTIEGQAVAVGKQLGEPSWYGLVDVPERQFFAGVFSALASVPRAASQESRCGAYRYELPDSVINDNLRFSLYAIPDTLRQSLHTKADKNCPIVARTSHSSILAVAQELLDTAQPLN